MILFPSYAPIFYYAHTNRLFIESLVLVSYEKIVEGYLVCTILHAMPPYRKSFRMKFLFCFYSHASYLGFCHNFSVSDDPRGQQIVVSVNSFGAVLQESAVSFTV